MTKTASAADVILPSTSWGEHEGVFTAANRGFQRLFEVVEPKWDLKTDWQIISEVATRMGYPMHHNNTQEIWDESRHLCPDFHGATHKKMGELGFIQWPCHDTSDTDQGTSYPFKEKFDTSNGLAQFFTCDWVALIDKLVDEYPVVLSTVREVGYYSCRSMTGNYAALAVLISEPGYAQISTEDVKRLGIEDEALAWVHPRRGKIITRAQVSDRPNRGVIYMTYQWWTGACNELITENLNPITKTPEYKYCVVCVEPIANQCAAGQYVIDEYNELKTRLREAVLAQYRPFYNLLSEAVFLPIRTLYTGHSLPNRIVKAKKITALMLFLTFFAHANDSKPGSQYLKAARAGDRRVQYSLADSWFSSGDLSKAEYWVQKVADSGDADACALLAQIKITNPVSPDYPQARVLVEKAA